MTIHRTQKADRLPTLAAIAISLALTGCGSKQPSPAPEPEAPQVKAEAPAEAEPVHETPAMEAAKPDISSMPAVNEEEPAPVEKPETATPLQNWPWWRGPTLDGVAPGDQEPPTEWNESKNVLWRVQLPGLGHGTPCVIGKRIFIGAGDKKARKIWIICLDRDSGAQIWKTTVLDEPLPRMHRDNSPVSATCAYDGERIFLAYQTKSSIQMVAVDVNGGIVWKKDVTPYTSMHGFGSSPAIYKDLVIIATDGKPRGGASRMVALNRLSGEVAWKIPAVNHQSYGAGFVMNVAGRDQVIVMGPDNTWSYNPATGEPLWLCKGPAAYCAATVAFNEDSVFVTGGYPKRRLFAIRADGSGDVARSHIVWEADNKVGYVPSPIYSDGLLYAVADKGLMRCYDAADGKIQWQHDFDAPFYSSPVLAGDRLYVFDRKGKGYVMAAGRELKLIATNTLPHGMAATPVILNGRIFIRSYKDFYCIGSK